MRQIGKNTPSVKTLLAELEDMCTDGLTPKLATVYRHLDKKGTKTKAQAAAGRQILNEMEEQTLVTFIQDIAARAFPLGRQRILRYALKIARTRHPDLQKIGDSWFYRFQACHPKELKAAWTKTLDTTRAAAVNPMTIAHYFELLKAILDEFKFEPSEIYGFDESGFPFGGDGVHERVYGGNGGVQHKQGEGNRENVSVMITICGDGTFTIPGVIFRAKHFDSAWAKVNADLQVK